MSEGPAKRRWFRFMAMTLFAAAIACVGWIATARSHVLEREKLRDAVLQKGCGSMGAKLGIQPAAGPIPVIWLALGAKPMPITCTLLPASQFSESEIERIRFLFPDVQVSVSRFGVPNRETRD